MKKLAFSIMAAVIFTFFISSYSASTEKNIADNVIRLHIIANSDSEKDQEIKLKIRDRIIKEMSPILSNTKNIEESKKLVSENIKTIQTIANDELQKNGFSENVQCFLTEDNFPVKTYGNITFPPGKYTALKIMIGSGEGKNWWCVMYPPLCFVDGDTVMTDENKKILKDNLDNDTYDLITQNGDPEIKIKFKIVEIFQNLNQKEISLTPQ